VRNGFRRVYVCGTTTTTQRLCYLNQDGKHYRSCTGHLHRSTSYLLQQKPETKKHPQASYAFCYTPGCVKAFTPKVEIGARSSDVRVLYIYTCVCVCVCASPVCFNLYPSAGGPPLPVLRPAVPHPICRA